MMVRNLYLARNFFVYKLLLIFSQLLETNLFFTTVAIELIIQNSNPLFKLGLFLVSVIIDKEVLQPSNSFFSFGSFILFKFLFMPV